MILSGFGISSTSVTIDDREILLKWVYCAIEFASLSNIYAEICTVCYEILEIASKYGILTEILSFFIQYIGQYLRFNFLVYNIPMYSICALFGMQSKF